MVVFLRCHGLCVPHAQYHRLAGCRHQLAATGKQSRAATREAGGTPHIQIDDSMRSGVDTDIAPPPG
jgi:hypothetical protein